MVSAASRTVLILVLYSCALFAAARDLLALDFPRDCANNWRADLMSQEGEWLGEAVFEIVGADKMLYTINLQENVDISLAEISLQATQPDTSLLSLTVSLPLCNSLFCPEPYFFQTSSAMMHTLVSAATLGMARLTVQTTGPYGQRLSGDISLDCNLRAFEIPTQEPVRIDCPLAQAPVAYKIPKGCSGMQERLETHCGLSAQAVALASGFLYAAASQEDAGFGSGLSVCLPEGCRPCEVEPMALKGIQMRSDGHFQVVQDISVNEIAQQPPCTHPDFPVQYTIPAQCDRFSDRAAVTCGLSPAQLTAASTLMRSGNSSPFTPGTSICLPDSCDPCANEDWFDIVMADVMDADLQKAMQQLGNDNDLDEPSQSWDITVSAFRKNTPAKVQADQVDKDVLANRSSSILSKLKFW